MSGMTSDSLKELRRIAEAATQRMWAVYDPHDRGEEYLIVTGTGERIVLAVINKWARTIGALDTAQADAQHIATFDPPTALALLDEIERLRREREVLVEALIPASEALADLDKSYYRVARQDPAGYVMGSVSVASLVTVIESTRKALALLDGKKGGGGA